MAKKATAKSGTYDISHSALDGELGRIATASAKPRNDKKM